MVDVSYEQVLELARQLSTSEQLALIEALRARQKTRPTRESILAEFERRKAAGEFENDSLYFGKYANPAVNISIEELDATIREAATEWEKEIDEFFGED